MFNLNAYHAILNILTVTGDLAYTIYATDILSHYFHACNQQVDYYEFEEYTTKEEIDSHLNILLTELS